MNQKFVPPASLVEAVGSSETFFVSEQNADPNFLVEIADYLNWYQTRATLAGMMENYAVILVVRLPTHRLQKAYSVIRTYKFDGETRYIVENNKNHNKFSVVERYKSFFVTSNWSNHTTTDEIIAAELMHEFTPTGSLDEIARVTVEENICERFYGNVEFNARTVHRFGEENTSNWVSLYLCAVSNFCQENPNHPVVTANPNLVEHLWFTHNTTT